MQTTTLEINHNAPQSDYIGLEAVFDSYKDGQIVGVVERFDGTSPVIRFDDGRWGYGHCQYLTIPDATCGSCGVVGCIGSCG